MHGEDSSCCSVCNSEASSFANRVSMVLGFFYWRTHFCMFLVPNLILTSHFCLFCKTNPAVSLTIYLMTTHCLLMKCPHQCWLQLTPLCPGKIAKVMLGEASHRQVEKLRRDCWHWFPLIVLVFRCLLLLWLYLNSLFSGWRNKWISSCISLLYLQYSLCPIL